MASEEEVLSVLPTSEAWESHQDEIKRLYRQENKTIKQVQQIMDESHDFSLRGYADELRSCFCLTLSQDQDVPVTNS
jgi:Clr5 domain